MIRVLAIASLLLAGTACLATAEPPTFCRDWNCPDHLVCHSYEDRCLDQCTLDDHCRGDWVCEDRQCEELCVDSECPGGYSCEMWSNECRTACYTDGDCRAGYHCCEYYEDCEYDECVPD